MFDNSVTPAQQINPSPMFTQEFFFWSPDNALALLKQAHVIKKFLKHAKATNSALTKKSTGLANTRIHNLEYWLTTDGLHGLIYPNWRPTLYQFKPRSPLFGEREAWFQKIGSSDVGFLNYQRAIFKKWQATPDHWKNDPSDPSRGFKHIWSREYNLGQ
jgi:hypothetical protein